jgi:hypothetical protein
LEGPVSEQHQDFNLRFLKPSQSFYNQIMSLWFKYLHILSEAPSSQNLLAYNPTQITSEFLAFCQDRYRDSQTLSLLPEEHLIPLKAFCGIIVRQYSQLLVASQGAEEDEDASSPAVSMCAFFDKVKSALLALWEAEIVQKSSQF